jgi:hypothetical protein
MTTPPTPESPLVTPDSTQKPEFNREAILQRQTEFQKFAIGLYAKLRNIPDPASTPWDAVHIRKGAQTLRDEANYSTRKLTEDFVNATREVLSDVRVIRHRWRDTFDTVCPLTSDDLQLAVTHNNLAKRDYDIWLKEDPPTTNAVGRWMAVIGGIMTVTGFILMIVGGIVIKKESAWLLILLIGGFVLSILGALAFSTGLTILHTYDQKMSPRWRDWSIERRW